MSQQNVDLVVGLYPPPDVDHVRLFRTDASMLAAWSEAVAPFLAPDFECAQHLFGSEKTYAGLDGLRDFMLDWMAPWVTYRIEVGEAIDLGERVLLLNNDSGRREGSTQEVSAVNAALWSLREGKIARVDVYQTRADALKALGREG